MKTCSQIYKESLISHPLFNEPKSKYWPNDRPVISNDEVINLKLDAIMYTLDELIKKANAI